MGMDRKYGFTEDERRRIDAAADGDFIPVGRWAFVPGEPKLHPGIMNIDPLIASRYIEPGAVLGQHRRFSADELHRVATDADVDLIPMGQDVHTKSDRWRFWACVVLVAAGLAYVVTCWILWKAI